MPKHRLSASPVTFAAFDDPSPRTALLLARQRPDDSDDDVTGSLAELAHLLEGLGVRVVDRVVQKRAATGAAPFGKGKLAELAARLAGDTPPWVVVDEALAPGQLRQLESTLGAPVLDRTDVILRVFARRARTRTAQLEVELAQSRYQLPRVRDTEADPGGREGGGGRGERGHTNVELRKDRLRDRIATLERELAALRPLQARQRERRRELPTVALVGYTNAGKSSLMRGLTGSDVLVADKLFATLDTTVRALVPVTTPRILLTDTVGFIRNLPHELVTSFRTTLDEARDADLLAFVVDAADPRWREQLAVTRATIAALGADTPPALVVLNKIDRVPAEARSELSRTLPDAVQVSALDAGALSRLRDQVIGFFDQRMLADVLAVPAADGRLLADIRARSRSVDRDDSDGDTLHLHLHLHVRALPEAIGAWRAQLAPVAIDTPAALLARAGAHGLALTSDAAATFDDSGLDFRALVAHDAAGAPFILRTPRRPEVVRAAAREARALALVRPALPVAVPDWRLHAYDVIAYPRLPGTPAVTFDEDGMRWNVIDPATPTGVFLDSYAAALAALQAIPIERAKYAGLPVDSIAGVRAQLAEAMAETRDVLAPPDPVWARWQRWLDDDAGWPDDVVLVHGDLHPGHLLLDEQGRLTGILDWTEARVTDPSVDLALCYGAFGDAGLTHVLTHLDRPDLAAHVRERWAAFPALVAAWALRTNNDAVLAHARGLLAAVN